MVKHAKRIAENDNIVTAVADFAAEEEVTVNFQGKDEKYICNQDVPFGHKIATLDIKQGEKLIKYGEIIGSASQSINKGDWVHVHNVIDDYKCLDKEGNPLPGQEGITLSDKKPEGS